MIYAYSTINVAVGNTPRPFFLRKQSSDEDVVRDVFSRLQYDLAHLPRFEDLRSFVQRKEANGRIRERLGFRHAAFMIVPAHLARQQWHENLFDRERSKEIRAGMRYATLATVERHARTFPRKSHVGDK